MASVVYGFSPSLNIFVALDSIKTYFSLGQEHDEGVAGLNNEQWRLWLNGGCGCGWTVVVVVVVERLACLPVTQKIGVRFYLERESSATSGWINVGLEWCCQGWSIEGGTPGGLFRTRDGLPRIRKARAARNVHECESVCAWNINIVSAPKWLPCMNAYMCAVFHCICMCMCSN